MRSLAQKAMVRALVRGLGRSELGDEGVVRTDRLCQVTDEGLEKLLAGAVRGPLDDRTECGEFFGHSAGHVVGSFEVARFSAAFAEALCVWAIDTCLTTKAPVSPERRPRERIAANRRRHSIRQSTTRNGPRARSHSIQADPVKASHEMS